MQHLRMLPLVSWSGRHAVSLNNTNPGASLIFSCEASFKEKEISEKLQGIDMVGGFPCYQLHRKRKHAHLELWSCLQKASHCSSEQGR